MPSKKQWGNATWYLFHTLAYKIKNDSHIKELLYQIYNICHNLPCNDCATHAASVLKTVNMVNINTKEKLIKLIFEFHNLVNKRTGKEAFTMEQHDELYSRANTRKIIENFIIIMKHNNYTEKGMLHSFKRRQCVSNFIKYINEHINEYNP